jgi:hypothetical protein
MNNPSLPYHGKISICKIEYGDAVFFEKCKYDAQQKKWINTQTGQVANVKNWL